MCARFNLAKSIQAVKEFYKAHGVEEWKVSYNIAPTDTVPIVTEQMPDDREIQLMRFGYPISKGGKTFPLLNLQSEKAANRKDLIDHRCIIPATGFYEWEKVDAKTKQPWHFSLKDDGLISFAGVWRETKDGSGFIIFTTEANELLKSVHGRMPVILGHNAIGTWLSPEINATEAFSLLAPYPANLMQAWKVDKQVNSVRNNGPICIMPINSA